MRTNFLQWWVSHCTKCWAGNGHCCCQSRTEGRSDPTAEGPHGLRIRWVCKKCPDPLLGDPHPGIHCAGLDADEVLAGFLCCLGRRAPRCLTASFETTAFADGLCLAVKCTPPRQQSYGAEENAVGVPLVLRTREECTRSREEMAGFLRKLAVDWIRPLRTQTRRCGSSQADRSSALCLWPVRTSGRRWRPSCLAVDHSCRQPLTPGL